VRQQNTIEESASINPYEALESWARANFQDFIQGLLEQEVNEFIGRLKSERHVGPDRRVTSALWTGTGKRRGDDSTRLSRMQVMEIG
jgi:hypothetical protein